MASPGLTQLPDSTNETARLVVDAALKVHRYLGPGLLESAYRVCLVHELHRRGAKVQEEVPLPVSFEGIQLDAGYRMDLVVNDCVVVEIKAVEALIGLHNAQLLSYLKLSGKRLGLLINFHSVLLKDGLRRLIN
jgi:GxxExxY protein